MVTDALSRVYLEDNEPVVIAAMEGVMTSVINYEREREREREREHVYSTKLKSLYNIYKIKNRVVRRLSLRLNIAASATATKK